MLGLSPIGSRKWMVHCCGRCTPGVLEMSHQAHRQAEERRWRREWEQEQDQQEREAYDAHMWESLHSQNDSPGDEYL